MCVCVCVCVCERERERVGGCVFCSAVGNGAQSETNTGYFCNFVNRRGLGFFSNSLFDSDLFSFTGLIPGFCHTCSGSSPTRTILT